MAETAAVPARVMTTEYVREIARIAYLWAWPMVNLHTRLAAFVQLPGPGLIGGVVPAAPPNHLAMLHDYVTPDERIVACPNQDVVYGFGPLTPGQEPAIVQVPDVGDRFWVYQLCDQRTDGFADELPLVLDEVPARPGEEALYAMFRSVLAVVGTDDDLRAAFLEAADAAEQQLVAPLF